MQEENNNEKMKRNILVQQKNKNSYSKGITLVALVITIIVLIILAGVSINLVLGEDGIFKRAVEAREKTEQAAINEQAMLNSVYEEMTKLDNENLPPNPRKTVEEAKTEGTYFDEQTELKDSDGNKVVVPKDFKIAQDSGKNVTEGIVIEDKDITTDGNGDRRGNQYVWIPVSNIDGKGTNKIKKSTDAGKIEEIEITLGRYEFANDSSNYKDNNGNNLASGTEILRQKAEDYADETLISPYYQELKDYREGVAKYNLTGLNRTAKELGKFIDSVKVNGGYYIARYEASYGEDKKPNSKVSNNFLDENTSPTQEGYLWNNITQIDAAKACENMYDTVSSDLVNSYAWDTAIVYIQKFSGVTDYSRQDGKLINSNLTNTGKNGDNVCKIHDMASNCREWTTEYSTDTSSSSTSPCVFRGGYYNDSGYYTSRRYDHSATSSIKYSTFRSTLYINKTES